PMTAPANRRAFLAAASLGAVAAAIAPVARAQVVPTAAAPFTPPATGLRIDPREFGATADGATKDTSAIQQALDRCAVLGGGEVVLAGGVFLSGPIRIGSNTVLRVEEGATLQGSPDLADYPIMQVRWE